MEFYSAVKKKVKFAGKCMELGNVIKMKQFKHSRTNITCEDSIGSSNLCVQFGALVESRKVEQDHR